MLKILNLWPIKIISANVNNPGPEDQVFRERINHLPSNSATFFWVQFSNRSKREAKVTDLLNTTCIVIGLDQGIGK